MSRQNFAGLKLFESGVQNLEWGGGGGKSGIFGIVAGNLSFVLLICVAAQAFCKVTIRA